MNLKKISKQELEALYKQHKTIKNLSIFLGASEPTVRKYFKKYGIESTIGSQGARKYNYDESYFEDIDCEEKAYWLGFLMADGCVYAGTDNYSYRLQINLKLSDKYHLERFQKSLGSHYKIQEKYLKNSGACTLKINSTKLCKDLIRHGIIPRKSLNCKKPDLSDSLMPHFIRGYFDGDGCITCDSKNRWKFSFSGGEDMMLFLKEQLECKTFIYKIKNSKAFSLEAASKESLAYFYDYIYSDATIYLDRKKEKYDKCHFKCPI